MLVHDFDLLDHGLVKNLLRDPVDARLALADEVDDIDDSG